MIFWFTTRGEVGLSVHYVEKLEKRKKKMPDIYWHDPIHGVNKGDLTISQPLHFFAAYPWLPSSAGLLPNFLGK